MMASADGPAKVAQNNSDAGDPADFGTGVEPVAFCRANGCLRAMRAETRRGGGIVAEIVVDASRRDHDHVGDQRQRHRKFR